MRFTNKKSLYKQYIFSSVVMFYFLIYNFRKTFNWGGYLELLWDKVIIL